MSDGGRVTTAVEVGMRPITSRLIHASKRHYRSEAALDTGIIAGQFLVHPLQKLVYFENLPRHINSP